MAARAQLAPKLAHERPLSAPAHRAAPALRADRAQTPPLEVVLQENRKLKAEIQDYEHLLRKAVEALGRERAAGERLMQHCRDLKSASLHSKPVLEKALAAARKAADECEDDDSKTGAAQKGANECADDDSNRQLWSAAEWSKSLDLAPLIADCLCAPLDKAMQDLSPAKRSAAELAFFRSVGGDIRNERCDSQVLAGLLAKPSALRGLAKKYGEAASGLVDSAATVDDLSNKFVQTGNLYFGNLEDFNGGFHPIIGPPNPQFHKAMEEEHTRRSDSEVDFKTGNYGILTQSQIEWWFVVDPAVGREKFGFDQYPNENESLLAIRKRRHEMQLHEYDPALAGINASLTALNVPAVRREELIAARLYTGPMFRKYNAVMRGVGKGRPDWAVEDFEKTCMGNKYSTTIWTINSCIIKLGKLLKPDKVYRGVSGRGLPSTLREPSADGVVGGIDVAFLSTTRDLAVAKAYATGAEGSFGMVLEICQGLIDRGADLSWLSQYPFEKEILFAPLTALEVMSTRVEGRLLMVEMRPTVNQNGQTIDEAIGKMQRAQAQFVDMLIDNFSVVGDRKQGPAAGALRPLEVLQMSHKLRDASWYNATGHFQQATNEALAAKKEVVRLLGKSTNWDQSAEADQIFLAAELVAFEGDQLAAVRLLQSWIQKESNPRVRKDDQDIVDELMHQIEEIQSPRGGSPNLSRAGSKSANFSSGGPASVSSFGDAARVPTRQRLLLLQMLLALGATPPWTGVIVKLVATGDAQVAPGFQKLLKRHKKVLGLRERPFELGQRVLAVPNGKIQGKRSSAPAASTGGVGVASTGSVGYNAEASSAPVMPPADLTEEELAVARIQAEYRAKRGAEKARRGDDEMWMPGKIHHIRGDGTYVVNVHGEHIFATSILPLGSDGGAGGLLRAAAQQGEVDVLDQLLEAGVFVEEADAQADTALHCAAVGGTEGHAKVCQRLMQAAKASKIAKVGFKPNMYGVRPYDLAVSNQNGNVRRAIKPSAMDTEIDGGWATDLMLASVEGSVVKVRSLLAENADLFAATQKENCTALTMAAEVGHLAIVEELLEYCKDDSKRRKLVNLSEKKNVTALMRAAQNDFPNVVEALLNADADVNARRQDTNRTSLVAASRNGHVSVVRVLLDRDADRTPVDKDGLTALSSAAKFGHAAVIEALTDHHALALQKQHRSGDDSDTAFGKRRSASLLLACRFGHADAVRALVQRGVDVDVKDSDSSGRTPLLWACICGHDALIPILLDAGANPIDADRDGCSSLMHGCRQGHTSIVLMLINYKADVSQRDENGCTALMWACRAGQAAQVQLLINSSGSSASSIDTPRSLSPQGSHTQAQTMRQELLNAQDAEGKTALHHAIASPETVMQLLQSGADRHLLDNAGQTALIAAHNEDQERTIQQFHATNGALQYHRPPLRALSREAPSEVRLGVGALVIDVGTGEMKLLAYLHFERVQMYELAEIKMSKIEPGATSATIFTSEAAGGPLETPAFAKISELLSNAADGLVDYDWFENVTWTHGFLGATEWYRKLTEDKKQCADRFIGELLRGFSAKLKRKGLELEIHWSMINGTMEAQYEYKAVEYAMREQERPQPLATIAGGSGSVQVTGLDSFSSFPAALKEGEQVIKSAPTKEEGLARWQEQVGSQFKSGALISILGQAADRAQTDGRTGVTIVIISAFFYAAVAAKLTKRGLITKDLNKTHPASYVCEELDKLIQHPKTEAKDLANASRLLTILRRMFDESCMGVVDCLFARDWELEGKAEFRTTWTAGWWLDQLLEMYRKETMPMMLDLEPRGQ